jgi:small-conductance mechanosensitive channel
MDTLVRIVIEAAITIGVAAALGETLAWAVRSLLLRAGSRRTTIRGVGEGIRATWIVLAGFAIASEAQLTSVLTILTVSGIVGLVVSLALQTTLSNIVSGVMLLRNQVLRLGDQISYSGVKGRVVRISLINTWIRTEEGNLAFVGNTSLLGGPFVNVTAKERLPEFVADTLPPTTAAAAPPVTAPAAAGDRTPTRTS